MGKGDGTGYGSGDSRGKSERVAVPAMPMPLAILCCIFNFLVPGLGTILAGLSVFCCARNEDMSAAKRVGSCCASFGIGILQLLTTALLLIGWIWSCVWGVFFLGMSSEYYHDNPPDSDVGRVIQTQPQPSGVHIQPSPTGYQYPQGGGYQQPQPQWQGQQHPGFPPQQLYGHHQPPQPYGEPQPGPYELPPPYTETANPTPSAPPIEKM